MFRTYLTGAFYNLRDRAVFGDGLNKVLAGGSPNQFAGDNMMAFGRAMTFLDDAKLMAAFQGAGPDAVESSLLWRLHVLCWGARRGLRLQGDFVEAACYKGFTVRVLCDALDFGSSGRTYWAYDMFDVAPDDPRRLNHHGTDLYETVAQRFADLPNVRLVKGEVPASFALGEPERIAFLHLDMNNAAAELQTLDRFYDRISPGAAIVLDDFGWTAYDQQRNGAIGFFAHHGLQVLELPTGQGLVIK